MSVLKQLVSRPPLFVPAEWDIDRTIKAMIDRKTSSVLVYEDDGEVVGILTERDILRKVSILDVDRKLGRRVRAIMTRPVRFATLATLDRDILEFHRQLGLRHYPVLKAQGAATKDNVAGVLTVTDIARCYLDSLSG